MPTLGLLMLQTRFPRPAGDVGHPQTFGFAVRRQVVQLGLRREGWVEVREGLRGDEQVIRSGWHKVFPGDPVRVRSAPAEAVRP